MAKKHTSQGKPQSPTTKIKKPDKYNRTYLSKSHSFHPKLYEQMEARAAALGMKMSEYLSQCVRLELSRGGNLVIPAKRPDGGDTW